MAPGSPYEDDHFLDFLLSDPKERRAVYGSFRGLRRFSAFIDETQYEFSICFSVADLEANYSLEKFVDRILQLRSSRRGSLKSLNNQVREGPGWGVLAVGNLLLLFCVVLAKGIVWLSGAFIVLLVLLNVGFLRFAWKSRLYLQKLRERIEAEP
jgi:hypothetical protein